MQYQQAIDEIRHLHASSQQTQQSQHRIRAEIASLSVEFRAMEVALLDKTQQQSDGRAEMARREEEWRRDREEREERWRQKRAEWKRREADLVTDQAERERSLKELMVRQAEEREEEERRLEAKVSELDAGMAELSAKHRDECRLKEEQLYEAREQLQSATRTTESARDAHAAYHLYLTARSRCGRCALVAMSQSVAGTQRAATTGHQATEQVRRRHVTKRFHSPPFAACL